MGDDSQKIRFSFEAIGTHWIIDIEGKVSDEIEIKKLILDRIELFDKIYSRFRDDSLVSEMARRAGSYDLPDDAKSMMDLYQKLYHITDGLFTPLIGKTLEQAGYDKDYSLVAQKLNAPPTWNEALNYDFPHLEIQQSVTLDFGAAGKGYLIDIVGQLLREQGITSFTIDAGGDLLYQTSQNQKLEVGLEDPEDTTKAIGVTKISNQALAGTAGNRRKWGTFHHIINPKTLRPAEEAMAVWVTAESAMLADALATCLFLDPKLFLEKEFEFDYLIMFADRSIRQSKNFPAILFFK